MKKMAYFFGLATMLIASTTVFSARSPIKDDGHAVEISISSITGVDSKATHELRKLIGTAVAKNIVDKFIIYGYDLDGGFSACIQEKSSGIAPTQAFDNFVKQLTGIHPNANMIYTYNRIKSCFALAEEDDKPDTLQVAKLDGSIYCNPNSGISLAETLKDLGDISVYSAAKKVANDKSECGEKARRYNVFEIPATNINEATELGFSTWEETTHSGENQENVIALTAVAATATIVYELHYIIIDGDVVSCNKHRKLPLPHIYVGSCM